MQTTVNNGFAPIREVTHQEVQEFVMPVPQVGQAVLWYRRGLKNDRGAEIKFVERINGKSVSVNGGFRNVLHVDDPRLMLNEHQREDGAWEFTPYHVDMLAKFAQLEKLVQEATKQLNAKK